MSVYGAGPYGAGPYDVAWTGTATAASGVTVPITPGAAPAVTVAYGASPDSLTIDIAVLPPTLQTRLSKPATAPFMDDLVGDWVSPSHTQGPAAEHILGIGPWSSNIEWRGAPNWGAPRNGTYPSAPVVALPPASNLSFTLRLNGGSEATADFDLPRMQAFYVEKMTTDLWWRRRRPATSGAIDIIGRFNADKVDVAPSGTGLRISCTFVDYRQLIGERLILTYAQPTSTFVKVKNARTTENVSGTSAWAKGTAVTTILKFILPGNANIDLAALDTTNLGIIKEPVEIPLGTTVEDAMDAVLAVSTQSWEWWIDLPDANGSRPRLRLAPQRGRDTGITLLDTGTGQGPIASWTIQGSSQDYANTIYLVGGDGGAVNDDPTQTARYMQRDATFTDTGLKGNVNAIVLAAGKKLAEVLDPRPALTVTLANNYWQGPDHINVGDTVNVYIALGADTITSTYRVAEISGSIDSAGNETITLQLGNPTPNKDPRSRYSVVPRLVRLLKNYQSMERSV